MAGPPKSRKRKAKDDDVSCPHCGKLFSPFGVNTHVKACKKKHTRRAEIRGVMAAMQLQRQDKRVQDPGNENQPSIDLNADDSSRDFSVELEGRSQDSPSPRNRHQDLDQPPRKKIRRRRRRSSTALPDYSSPLRYLQGADGHSVVYVDTDYGLESPGVGRAPSSDNGHNPMAHHRLIGRQFDRSRSQSIFRSSPNVNANFNNTTADSDRSSLNNGNISDVLRHQPSPERWSMSMGGSEEGDNTPRRFRHSSDPGPESESEPDQNQNQYLPELDDIKVEYHPSSHRPEQTFSFSEYKSTLPERTDIPVDPEPWRPFRSRVDFELAELMQDTYMSSAHKQALISLVQQCVANPKQFTLESVRDLDKLWEASKYHVTPFQKQPVAAELKGEPISFDMYSRPLWDWCVESMADPHLISQFRWDAERHYKYNPKDGFERFIEEPWTGDDWWDFQSSIPEEAKPFAIILYADKTQLSSFGKEKGYPVLARCANLPVEIRNRHGLGGDTLVGWLPVIPDNANVKGAGQKKYADFKRVIWHQAFYEIIKSVEKVAKTGYRCMCGDKIVRWIFPFIIIASADYEEQCTMALIRGAKGKRLCPVCLVPTEICHDLTRHHDLRTTENMRKVYNDSQEPNMSEKEKEILLKEYGLRGIENVFWKLEGCQIYQALSWDRLHAYHLGLFGDHLLGEVKRLLDQTDRRTETRLQVEQQLRDIPRWSGLYNFTTLNTGEFSDGSRFEQLSKVLLYATHNIISHSDEGRAMNRLLRSYLELDMLLSLEVHTQTTLRLGREELLKFSRLLDDYISYNGNPEKNWSIPKLHTHVHAFDDVQRKGATRNFNTKVNEQRNGPLKRWYKHQTNFKNIAPQILELSDRDLIAIIMRAGIDRLDEAKERLKIDGELAADGSNNQPKKARHDIGDFDHTSLGSKISTQRALQSLGDIEADFPDDPAFQNLRIKINKWFSSKGIITRQRAEALLASHQVTGYQLLRVKYESQIDWKSYTDLVRVNKNFYHTVRNDYIMVKTSDDGGFIFGQLLYLFKITVKEVEYSMALILPFDLKPDTSQEIRQRDTDLRFARIRSRPRTKSAIIHVDTIIRGAPLVLDYSAEHKDEYIVLEMASDDIWMRMKSEGSLGGRLEYNVSLS